MWLITISIVSGRFLVIKISPQTLHFTFQNAEPVTFKKKQRGPVCFSLSQGCPFLQSLTVWWRFHEPRADLCQQLVPQGCTGTVPVAMITQQQGAQSPLWSLCETGAHGQHSPSRDCCIRCLCFAICSVPGCSPCLKPKGWFVLWERISLSHW